MVRGSQPSRGSHRGGLLDGKPSCASVRYLFITPSPTPSTAAHLLDASGTAWSVMGELNEPDVPHQAQSAELSAIERVLGEGSPDVGTSDEKRARHGRRTPRCSIV